MNKNQVSTNCLLMCSASFITMRSSDFEVTLLP